MIQFVSYTFIFILLIIACSQDFKRREIDHWLNISIFLIGTFSLLFFVINNSQLNLLLSFLVLVAVGWAISQLFYRGKVFGGGDSDLLLALTPLFVQTTISSSALNLLKFVFIVLLAGSIYGLIYMFVSYFRNKKRVDKELKKELKPKKVLPLLIIGLVICFLGFLDISFTYLGVIIIVFPFFYYLARTLEKTVMSRKIKGSALYGGDILTKKIKYNGKIFLPSKKELTEEEAKFLRNAKTVEIKDGVPFAPSFLIALIIYLLIDFGIIFQGFLF